MDAPTRDQDFSSVKQKRLSPHAVPYGGQLGRLKAVRRTENRKDGEKPESPPAKRRTNNQTEDSGQWEGQLGPMGKPKRSLAINPSLEPAA